MVSDELKTIIENIEKQGQMSFLEKATEEQISIFEKTNGIHFPEQYKEWLQFSDGGEFFLPAGVQFYGVHHKPLVDINDDDKPNDNYVIIGALSTGDPIVFEKGHEQISIYNHDAGVIEPDETYENFFEFLKNLRSMLGLGE